MKLFRSHISKVCIIGLLYAGLMLAVAKPVHAMQTNEAFANWLQSLAKKTPTAQLEQRLSSLKQSDPDLNKLIKQASEIISENDDDFNLPEGAAADNIQQILLVEWNQYQSGNAMRAVPSTERVKPTLNPQQLHPVTPDLKVGGPVEKDFKRPSGTAILYSVPLSGAYLITPLVSSIAIGAP